MALTPSQQTALKAFINGDPTLSAFPNTADGAFAVAVLLNQPATPSFFVWRSNMPTADAKKAMVWTEFIGRSAGERDAWTFMLSNGIINASDANVRQGILDIFSGPSGAGTRAALLAIAARLASVVEKLFSTGTGSQASPATMTREGAVSFQDVWDARLS